MTYATIEQRFEAMRIATMGRWVAWTDEMGEYMELEDSFPFDAAEANAEISQHVYKDLEEILDAGVTGSNLEMGLSQLISCYKIRTWKMPNGINRTEQTNPTFALIQRKQLEELKKIILTLEDILNLGCLEHLTDYLEHLPGVPGDVKQSFGKTLVA